MNWYGGTIADAIKTAKSQQAIFVVFVEGNDNQSQLMSEVLNTGETCRGLNSSKIVAIKLPSDDVGYKQFVEIYKLVPVPSLFFIGNNGAPVDIVAADASKSNLESKIKDALVKCNITIPENQSISTPSPVTMDTAIPSTSHTPSASVASTQFIESENNAGIQAEGNDIPSLEDKVEKAKKLLEKKKQEKEMKEKEEEKEKEFERRRVGQEMLKAKKNQQDRELREMIEEREREKRETAAAKQKILDQIAQDRADRAEREQRMKALNTSDPPSRPTNPAPVERPPANVNSTRIQFKLPTGEARMHIFPPGTTLLQVRDFIDNNIELSFRDYRLATTFPRREFTHEDDQCSLSSVNLVPTGVILILPEVPSNMRPYTSDWMKVITNMFWDMVQPVFSLANYIHQYFTSSRPGNSGSTEPSTSSPPQPSQSQPSRPSVRRAGNVHSLRDIRDGNDENNTWNGNSTQQM